MTKIRKLYYFDKKNAAEMISFLDNQDSYADRIMFNPFIPLHYILPLKFKFLPESYVLKDKKEMKGLITVAPTKCPTKQMEIQKLLFEENCYEDAGELIQFVVSKYKALGTSSIIVRIDDYLTDLLKLLISKCNFSQISYEKLWKIDTNTINYIELNKKMFRMFRNSDAPVVSNIYNEQLLPHFRPFLSKEAKEFQNPIFSGLSYYSEYKFVYTNNKSNDILAYISIKTPDNLNYIVDIIQSSWESVDLNEILAFAIVQIEKRNKKFNLFMKTKKYVQQGEQNEFDCLERKFECIRNQIVLTNSSASIIRDEEREKKFTGISQFYGGVGVVNKRSL